MKTFKQFINEDINLNKFKITTESGKLKITKVIELVKLIDKEYPEMKEYEIYSDLDADLKLMYYPKEKIFRIIHNKYGFAREMKSIKDVVAKFGDLCFKIKFYHFAKETGDEKIMNDFFNTIGMKPFNPENN